MGIPLVRATTLYPMMLAMDEINVPTSKLLDEARIPQIDYCNPSDWISTERVLHLDSLVRRKGGRARSRGGDAALWAKLRQTEPRVPPS